MKKIFIFFVILIMTVHNVFAKSYQRYAWARETKDYGTPRIYLEVYSPYDENIEEKAIKKLDEIEEYKKKAKIDEWYYVAYIGSISEPSYQVHRTFSSVSAYIDIYNKCGEKIYHTESNLDDTYIDYYHQIDKLVEEVFPSSDARNQPYKIGDKGPDGGIIYYIGGNYAYECSERIGIATIDACNNNLYETPSARCEYHGARDYDAFWRLPTRNQLKDIYDFFQKSGQLEKYKNYCFWSSSKTADGKPVFMKFSDKKFYHFDDDVPMEKRMCSFILVRSFELDGYAASPKQGVPSAFSKINIKSSSSNSAKPPLKPLKVESKSPIKNTKPTPNFKVGDYIKELDATIFKIDGNNVTLYHWEGRNVSYSAQETFCKNYQKDGYSGWRLPTVDEMNYMYTYRIDSGTYWASTAKPEEQWAMDLVSGKWYKNYYSSLNIFVVRTFDVATINKYFTQPVTETEINVSEETAEKNSHEELRHNFKIGNYMRSCGTVFNVVGNKVYVFTQISYYNYTFAEAKDLCKNLTTGGYTDWRLPTAQELNFIYTNREAISTNREAMSVFSYEEYWCSSPGKGGKPQYLYLGNGTWITGTDLTKCSVIAVREFDF